LSPASSRRCAIEKAKEREEKKEMSDTALEKRVIAFLRKHRVLQYGGSAVHALKPIYEPGTPRDFDAFSVNPQLDAMNLVDGLVAAGWRNAQVVPALHPESYRIRVDNLFIVDLTTMSEELFNALWQKRIRNEGMSYVPINFLRMLMYLELSRSEMVSRWEKVQARLDILNELSPFECTARATSRLKGTGTLQEDAAIVLDGLKQPDRKDAVLLGVTAAHAHRSRSSKLVATFPFHYLVEPDRAAHHVKAIQADLAHLPLTVSLIKKYNRYVPNFYTLQLKGKEIIRIYEADACYRYHTTSSGFNLGSIGTLMHFFLFQLSLGQDTDMIECMASQLVDLAYDASSIHRRFRELNPSTCLGPKTSFEEMKAARKESREETEGSKAHMKLFFYYKPMSMTPQARASLRQRVERLH
jgi:hypothetical protein